MMGLTAAAASLASDPVLIVVGGALFGVANALIFVPSGPFLMENSGEDERLQVFSANFAVMALASVLGSLASGYLPAILAGLAGLASQSTAAYRLTLLVGAAACLLGAVPMLLVRAARRGRPAGRPGTAPAAPLTDAEARRAILHFSGSVVFIAFGTGLVLPFFNVFFARELGASVQEIGVIFAAGSLAMAPFSLLGPSLARRFGVVGGIAVARALTVPFIVSAAIWPTLPVGALAYIARNALTSATWPLDNAYAMELMPPRLRATQAGFRSASWNVGWAIASLLAGQVIVTSGYAAVFLGSGLFTAIGVVYHFLAFRGRRAGGQQPAARASAG